MKRRITLSRAGKLFLCLAALLCLTAAYLPAAPAEEARQPAPVYKTIEEMAGMRFAYVKGSVYDKYVESRIENTATMFFPSLSDCIAALEANKVDGVVQRSYALELAVNRRGGTVAMLPQTLSDMEEEYFFRYGDDRLIEFNAAIAALMEDGTIARLSEKWASADDSIKTLPEQDWDAPNGTLKFVTTGTLEPFSYVGPQGTAVGFDVDLALHICRLMGCHLETEMVGMDSIMAAVMSGKADFGGTLTYTEERAKSVAFSDSVMPVSVSVVVRARQDGASASANGAEKGPGQTISGLFHKTFIEENRWLLIVRGLGTTVLISVCAGALGLLLGFYTVIIRWGGKRFLGKLIDGYHALLGSVPIMVVLMVFYYVVFGSLDVPGELVAIIAFALAFGTNCGATMWTAVKGIDAVQTESGLALGYTRAQTFRKIVFPQAINRCLGQLMGQFVSLIKDSSIVGFIGVMDLTRAGDLIRARTLEAFFPLFAIAILYFAVCRILFRIITPITAYVGKKQHTLKGIKL